MWNSGPALSLLETGRVLSPGLGGPGFFASPTLHPFHLSRIPSRVCLLGLPPAVAVAFNQPSAAAAEPVVAPASNQLSTAAGEPDIAPASSQPSAAFAEPDVAALLAVNIFDVNDIGYVLRLRDIQYITIHYSLILNNLSKIRFLLHGTLLILHIVMNSYMNKMSFHLAGPILLI